MNLELCIDQIAETLNVQQWKVKNTITLLEDGATLPFIARYRKEKTGELDEVQIGDIKTAYEAHIELEKRKEYILKTIAEQGKLTDTLRTKITNALTSIELEDLYLPYKQKRKTKGSIAIEKGLKPLAKVIFEQKERSLDAIIPRFVGNKVKSKKEALDGAIDIIAEWINENSEARGRIRQLFERTAVIHSNVKKDKSETGVKYKDYFSYEEKLHQIPSHRLLAVRRGEDEGFLRVKITVSDDKARDILERQYLRGMPACKEQMSLAIVESLKRLLLPSIENEFNKLSKEKSDAVAIEVFAKNLKKLLLDAPLGQKTVLAIDPGFRTGCKTVVLNQQGELIHDTVLYILDKKSESAEKLKHLIAKYKIEAIAIGNGTASRETEEFVKKTMPQFTTIFVVSEQGASIYSASTVAREEFPNKDITVRGAVSIGRRLMDPLAELVKLDPKSIGVGQYQHDVNQKELKESLDTVVESCVNNVGVELNSASKHLLAYVSGLGESLAQNIIDYRRKNGKFKSRRELLKVPRLGDKAFEQAAGFLRIRNAKNPLDNTGVHPERYDVIKQMASRSGGTINTFIENATLRQSIDLKSFTTSEVGLPTLKDIMKELEKPGRDPREQIEAFAFADVHTMEDLHEAMVLPGIVTNVTAFGCFVDIGVHQDGLVHISQLADKYVSDPNEVVSVQQKVKVKVMEVDVNRKRIGLSMKGLN